MPSSTCYTFSRQATWFVLPTKVCRGVIMQLESHSETTVHRAQCATITGGIISSKLASSDSMALSLDVDPTALITWCSPNTIHRCKSPAEPDGRNAAPAVPFTLLLPPRLLPGSRSASKFCKMRHLRQYPLIMPPRDTACQQCNIRLACILSMPS